MRKDDPADNMFTIFSGETETDNLMMIMMRMVMMVMFILMMMTMMTMMMMTMLTTGSDIEVELLLVFELFTQTALPLITGA